MPSSLADRNLLFGILALQMDFVARDALIEAMNAWVLDKSRPLSDILVARGFLAPARRALLDSLVTEHLAQHDDDLKKSLAAVECTLSLRSDLASLGDAEIDASLAVNVERPQGDSLCDTLGAGSPASASGRFEILRPHAQGGLGKVFVARDLELNREIALKEIHHRHAADPVSRSRFVQEAEITSRLEHPGIVPVYGLGQHPDGRPFYAMRFIRGDTLRGAIEKFHGIRYRDSDSPAGEAAVESSARKKLARSDFSTHALAFRQLLGRFVDACNAIGYAHSRGILHRDLKPSNIMLGDFGETLVVDWGLAKVLGKNEPARAGTGDTSAIVPAFGSSSAETMTGAAIGTPAFMSPEQAVGKIDELSPATDVYGLGATLYCILTGRPPFLQGEVGETLRKVERGEFPRPRELEPGVPAALEAVCLKAMANKPADRYPTPQALASDIEHWLADEPVAAWREPARLRARRWARRHRTLVASATALFLTAVVAGSLGFVALSREQAATETARAEATAAAHAAQAQTETTQAVSGFLKGMFEEPTPYAFFGIQIGARDIDPAAAALLDRATKRLLSGELDDQPAIKVAMLSTIGKAYFGVGMLDKGMPLLEGALTELRRQGSPSQAEIVALLDVLAQARFVQARSLEAEEFALECLRLTRSHFSPGHEAITTAKSRLAVIYSMTAQHCDETDRLWNEVLADRKRALAANDPAIAEALIALAGNSLWPWRNRAAAAVPLFLEGTRILAANPATKALGDAMGNTIQAEILGMTIAKASAAQRGGMALEQFRGLLGNHHPITVFLSAEYARRLFEQGRHQDALRAYDQVFQTFAERGLPFLQPAQEWLILDQYAAAMKQLGQADKLERTLGDVARRQFELSGFHSENGHTIVAYQARLLWERGLHDEAAAMVRRHVAGITSPGVAILNRYLVPLAHTLRELGYRNEEEAVLEKNVATARELVANAPDFLPGIAAGRRLDLALQLDQIAEFLIAVHRRERAAAPLREALAIRRELLGPEHVDIAGSLDRLADCLEPGDSAPEVDALRAESAAMKERLPATAKRGSPGPGTTPFGSPPRVEPATAVFHRAGESRPDRNP